MKNKLKRGIIFVMFVLLATSAYASQISDQILRIPLVINDFFASYQAYSQVIDFGFFALLFVSVYLIGVRYAFREVNKPEKMIAVLLGFMTAFLLVAGGISTTMLVPYVHWIFYFLLFVVIWSLLKGIKSRFWRLLIAIVLTLLIISLLFGFFNEFEITWD